MGGSVQEGFREEASEETCCGREVRKESGFWGKLRAYLPKSQSHTEGCDGAVCAQHL